MRPKLSRQISEFICFTGFFPINSPPSKRIDYWWMVFSGRIISSPLPLKSSRAVSIDGGVNVSSAATVVQAVGVIQTGSQTSPVLDDPGNSDKLSPARAVSTSVAAFRYTFLPTSQPFVSVRAYISFIDSWFGTIYLSSFNARIKPPPDNSNQATMYRTSLMQARLRAVGLNGFRDGLTRLDLRHYDPNTIVKTAANARRKTVAWEPIHLDTGCVSGLSCASEDMERACRIPSFSSHI